MEMIEPNKIYNEDCLEGMQRIPDGSVDCVITDPPYRVTAKGCSGTMSGYWTSKESNSGKIFKYNDIEIENYLPKLYRVLKEGTHCYIMCNHLNLPHFIDVINTSEFKFIKCLIWDKQTKICGKYYMGQFEYIIMLRKGKDRTINNCGTSDILSVPNKKTKGVDGNNIHNCEKPIELMRILIQNSSDEGEIILDPFMGSGTTAIAAIRTKRNFIGFELQKEYFDMAEKRIKDERRQLTLF